MALFSSKDSQENADEAPFQSRAEEESRATRSRKPRKASNGGRAGNDDALLPEKKRARRRLVGAIALVVAVVIGLPMVLDSEPKPLAEDIAIQIPSKDKVQPVPAAAPAPIVGDAPAAAAPAAPVVPAAVPAAAAALDQKEEIVDAPKAPADKLAVKAVDTTKPEAKPEPKAEAKAEPKPADVTEAKPAAKEPHKDAAKPEAAKPAPAVDEAARAKALLEGKPDPKAAKPEAKSEKLVLQVAAFASQDKVNEVQAKLKGAGIMSYTQKVTVAGSEKIRIRVLAQNKAEADRLQAKMKTLGFAPNVVQP